MKISLKYLRQVIKEELEAALVDKEGLYSYYSDIHKELYNFRPRMGERAYKKLSIEELDVLIDNIHAQLDAAVEQEKAARDEFEAEQELSEPYPGEEFPPIGGMGRGPR
jgi:hypothetical protein